MCRENTRRQRRVKFAQASAPTELFEFLIREIKSLVSFAAVLQRRRILHDEQDRVTTQMQYVATN